ncbi:dna repair protein rad4 containing protein [Stylonychia lemnae]|uniref:Dna repair protein rad4 containing protein n=1 Tax=Stylonychia lemnae TaxID=5949 RepID=A0A078AJE8_STYLE|nr:dna repair protein rad4 containing protein [Stylonychia lemnae]|eukprot:CDW80898.1 dna repair protein rad4 containing protein [Stylonychia lemnae]
MTYQNNINPHQQLQNQDEVREYQQNNLFLEDDYSDEDDKLFDQLEQDNIVAKIQESIDELLEKGKKKSLKYEELMQRRNARKQKLMQLDEAKTYLLLHIGRSFVFNGHQYNSLYRAIVLSMIPIQYQIKFMDRNLFQLPSQSQSRQSQKKESFQSIISEILKNFQKLFGHHLQPERECVITNESHFIKNLVENKGLSRIEYLILFTIFMNLHKIVHRVNFIIDIQTMEDSKKIKVTRKKTKDNQTKQARDKAGYSKKTEGDYYQYGKEEEIRKNKKRKRDDYFLQKKQMQISDTEEEVEKASFLSESFKKFKLNDDSKNLVSQNLKDQNKIKKDEEEFIEINRDYFDKFSFKPSGKSTAERSQIQKTNLSRVSEESYTKSKERIEQDNQMDINYDGGELSSTFEEGMFIQIYDEIKHNWCVICPFTGQYYPQPEQVQTYFRIQKTLFIIATQPYSSYESMRKPNKSQQYQVFMREIGTTFVNQKFIKDYLKSKNSCILTKFVEDFIHKFAPYISHYADKKVKGIIQLEQEQIEQTEMNFIPSTTNEFKNNKYYTLPSIIKKYQGFLPQAQPLPDKNFKGEPIFLKKDVSELHTVERWRRHAREVKRGEEPMKRVKGLYNDSERMAELYGFWQTQPWKNELTEDGKIPRLMSGPIPEGTMHIDIPKAALICKKLDIDFVPAVIGFEKGGNGKSHPCVSGVVTFQKYEKQVLDEYKKLMEQSKKREQDNLQKKAKKAWKSLIRSILVKKYVASAYDLGEVPMQA